MSKLMRGFCVFFLLILSGCASEQSLITEPDSGKAVIYIYRTDVTADTDFLAPNVRVNGKSLGSLLRRGYLRIELAPGAAQIALFPVDRGDENTNWPATRNAVVNLVVTADSTYFVELSLNTTLYKFSPATRERAEQAMNELHLLN
ncbi:MAG: DUF2846 domain-containing protein [Gammaproteobacteria bacterium]|nr:DUF2846 domain-containing protein [Gammaproteobacteria bacterium]MBU1967705.1 DUF2846 domain-containing protein [Gammaproteobacteria bacterium]